MGCIYSTFVGERVYNNNLISRERKKKSSNKTNKQTRTKQNQLE